MSNSNIRKLKKKYKADAILGIENLIDLYKEIDKDYTDLEKTLYFCNSIKPGNFGKKIYRGDADERIHTNWRIKDDFCSFVQIFKMVKNRILNIEYYYTGVRLVQEKASIYNELVDSVNAQINLINEKYRMEHRDSLIDLLLEE